MEANVYNIQHLKEFCLKISTDLIKQRNDSGCTQDHIAKMLGVSRKIIIDIDKGEGYRHYLAFLRYCEVMGVRVGNMEIKAKNNG